MFDHLRMLENLADILPDQVFELISRNIARSAFLIPSGMNRFEYPSAKVVRPAFGDPPNTRPCAEPTGFPSLATSKGGRRCCDELSADCGAI